MGSLQSGCSQQRMGGGSGFMRPVTHSQHESVSRPGTATRKLKKAVFRSVGCGDLALGRLARQRVVGAVVELPNTFVVETLLFHFQIGAQKQFRWQFLNSEPDRLRNGLKSLVTDRTARLAAAARKEFGRGAVVDHRHNQSSSAPNMALARPKIQHPAVAAYQPEFCRVNIEWAKNMARRAGAGPNPTKVGSLVDHFGNNFAGGWIDQNNPVIYHHVFVGPDCRHLDGNFL